MRIRLVLLSILVISSLVLRYYQIERLEGYLEIYVLDVGQGDSLLIKSPDNVYMLVDGGPDIFVVEQLEDVLPPWIDSIDYVLLTHQDADHLVGLIEVLERFNVKYFFDNGFDKSNFLIEELKSNILDNSIQNIQVLAQNRIAIGCCLVIDVIAPDSKLLASDVNNASIVFNLSYQNFSMLFTGDIEEEAERLLLDKFVDVDVLKSPHHGSRTSSTEGLLDRVQPEAVVISAGYDNKFGHPNDEILDRYKLRGIEVYRTDLLGRIKIISNGFTYNIE